MMTTEEKKEFNIQFWRFLWASILIGLSACLGNVVDAMIVGKFNNLTININKIEDYPHGPSSNNST